MTTTAKELYNKIDPFVVERIRSIVRSTSLASTTGTGTDSEALAAIRDAAILTVGNTSALNAERALTASGALSFTDGGANGNYTLALATPGALSVDSASDASTNHTHAITASDNPGATAALLKTSSAGGLTLVTATATTKLTSPLIDTASGDLTLTPSSGVVVVNSNLTAATSITTPLLNTASGGLTIAPSNSITSVTGAMVVSTSVQVPLITTADNVDLVINPAGTGAVQFPNAQKLRTTDFDSSFPIEGWQINEHVSISGKSVLTIGEIQADELSVRVFVADEVRVDRGDEYWTKSYGIVAANFVTPGSIGGTVSVMFEDSPALVGAIFSNNDWVLIRKLEIDSGLTLYSIWGQVSSYVNNADGTQSWTFTLRSGPTSEAITKGSLAIDFGASGAALIHLSVIDSAGAPYIKLRKWVTNPYTPSNYTTYLQLGQLGSIANAYYTPDGYGIYIRSTADEGQFIVADDNGLQIRGADFKIYDGSNQTVSIASDDGSVKLGTNIASDATTNFDFNGTSGALTVKGSLSATGGDVVANADGLNLIVFSGGSDPVWDDWGKALTFTTNPTTPAENNTVGQIYGQKNSTSWGRLTIEARSGTAAGLDDTSVRIFANRDDDVNKFAGAIFTNDNTNGGDVQIYAANGSGVLGNITMFGKLRTSHVVPISNNTWDLGASDAYYNDAYIRNLHIDTIVGTPTYSHSHAASEITSGTLDLVRIPSTLTGKDADTLDGYHASAFALAGGGITSIVNGGGISVSGTTTVTVSHADTSSVTNIDNSGGSVIQDLTFDTYGHVTAATGVNLDTRYAQALTQGAGISITGTLSGYTIAHSDTSSTGDVANTGSTFIQSMTFDTYGHVLSTTSTNITTALDSVYVNVSGDTMTGNLFIDADQASGGSVALGFVSNSSGNAGWRFNVRAHDYSVAGQQNDLVIARFDGTVSTNMLYFDYATMASTFGGSVTASGAGSFGADTEVHSYLGRAAIGYAAAADSATFAHYDHYTSTNFGFAQFSNGSTAVNAVTGQEIALSINDVATYSVNADRLLPRGSVAVDLGDYNRKIRTIHAAELAVQTLIAQDVIATVGGQIIVSPTSRLIADVSSAGTPGGADAIYTNLISYWSLDEVSGTRLDSKSTNHLTDRNTVTSTTGKVGVSAVFNKANSERLNIADNAALSVGDIDFYGCGWVYATSDDGTVQCVASKAGGANNRAWELEIDWAGSTNRFEFTVYNSSNATTQVVSAAISTNTWYFVEFWHNASTNQIGIAVNRTQTTATHTTGVKDETGNFTLGASNSGSHYTGRIDEFGFWKNYIPDTTRRDWLYNSGSGRSYTDIYNYGAGAFNFDLEHNSYDVGDFLYMAAAPGGVPQIEVFKVTSAPSTITGGYRYTAERDLDGSGANNWYAGDAVTSLGGAIGEGYINLTATSTIHGHYGPTIAHYVRRGTGAWDSIAPVVASGNLRSFVDYTGDEFGHAAGNDLLLTPEEGFKGYTIDTINGMRTFNVDISLYEAETRFLTVGTIGGIKIETNDSENNDNRSISFDQLGVTRAYIRTASELSRNSLILRTLPTSGFISRLSLFSDSGDSDNAEATLRASHTTSGETYVQSVQSPTANSSFVDLVTTGEVRVRGDRMVMYCDTDLDNYDLIDAGSLTMQGDIDLNGNDIIDIGTFGETWTGLSFGSGWGNFGGGFKNGKYKKAGDLIFLSGVVARTSGAGTTIATLPSGYRPATNEIFTVSASGAFGEIRVNTTGVIEFAIGSVTYVSLSGIVFSTLA